MVLQIFTFFRSFPENPACGRVIQLESHAKILINCDSAVFMKDAQELKRLWDGRSVYQDRPLYASVASGMAHLLKIFGFPEQSRKIVGNSGTTTEYFLTYYISFLFLNLFTLVAAVLFGLKYVFKSIILDNRIKLILSSIIILVIAGNEITKTYFWTPHSQMFNILLPTISLYLIQERKNLNGGRNFFKILALVEILLFFYSLTSILFLILLSFNWKNIYTRLTAIALCTLPYASLPLIIKFTGGEYQSIAITRYREFIWVIDAFKSGKTSEYFLTNFTAFLQTFPLTPILLLALVFFLVFRRNLISITKEYEIRFFLVYLVFFSLMGYYARRLTMGPMIFAELYAMRLFMLNIFSAEKKYNERIFLALLIFLFSSWILTNGPLV